jgi:tRNA (cytidine/uridine-2'-O-)-methyltransferase
MLNVVLVEPEIPANTGNIGRTCVLAGARLHLVGPLGSELTDQAVQRAGLAYWQSLDLRTYPTWEIFVERHPIVMDALAGDTTGSVERSPIHFLTKAGARTYADSTYADGDWLVFGKESSGLDEELLVANPSRCERIPMLGDDALVGAEGWHERYGRLHPNMPRDVCGNFVDPRVGQITSLNLSNAAAIVMYEALRQLGYPGMG